MAIRLIDKYPTRATAPTSQYPGGSFKNETVPGAKDGTPVDLVWGNDWLGFFEKLIAESGITVSDVPDTALNSDYFTALLKIFGKTVPSVADLDADASLKIGDLVTTETRLAGGTGGGASYKVVAAATGTDDGGSYIDLTASGFQLEYIVTKRYVDVRSWGTVGDDATDDAAAIQKANIYAASKNLWLHIPAGTYYVANPGVTLVDNTQIFGTPWTFLRCERTYFDDSGVGENKYVIGQGNIFNGDTLTNITLDEITLVGAYDTAWGNQIAGGPVPAGQGSKLLFLLDSENIVLNKFKIKSSWSSFVTLTSTWDNYFEDVYGYHQILVSGCSGVTLTDCKGFDSVGEAWHIFNCDDVKVTRSRHINDYGVSYMDITYCTKVDVIDSTFAKLLRSDTGNLLNVASSDVKITNNFFLNGECDIGNEYIAVPITIGQNFLLKNTIVAANTFYNGGVTFATPDGTTSLTWVQENATVTGNTIVIDIDTRPSATGTTVLEYTAVRLPAAKNNRNISVENNTVFLKGTLQSGGAAYNKIRIFNGLMLADGYNMDNITIRDNTVKSDLTSYDPDDVNALSGTLLIQYGNWTNLTFSDNIIDCPTGIMISEHDSITGLKVEDNTVNSENFFFMPYTATDFVMDECSIKNNKFNFYNTAGHTYTSSDLNAKGHGYFVNMLVGPTSTVENFDIIGNKVKSPGFCLMTNFASSPSVVCDVNIDKNNVRFIDYLSLDGGATLYPIFAGRVNTASDYSSFKINDNYFYALSASAPTITFIEWNILDMLRNQFIGDFTITLDTDNVAGDPASRFMAVDNIATGTITPSLVNVNSCVLKRQARNTTSLGINAAVTNNLATDA